MPFFRIGLASKTNALNGTVESHTILSLIYHGSAFTIGNKKLTCQAERPEKPDLEYS